MPAPLNSSADDWPCWLSADGTLLVLGSKRAGGIGEDDLWFVSRKTVTDAWQMPVNFSPNINTIKSEIFAHMAPDGMTLWFSGDYGKHGHHDIWQSRRVRK